MQSKDLRIGNLVKNNEPRYGDKILVIESIGDNDTVNVFFREYPMSALEPIPLTEEWLLNFGFKKHEHCRDSLMQMYYNNFILQLNRYKEIRLSIYDGDVNVSRCNYDKIKFVHQLQNLYFALTGEELELNNESKP